MTPAWNTGLINWSQVDRSNNVIQVYTNSVNTASPLRWWRNEQPGETLGEACRQFAQQFDFKAMPAGCVACTVQEWSPDGKVLIRDEQFGFTPEDVIVNF